MLLLIICLFSISYGQSLTKCDYGVKYIRVYPMEINLVGPKCDGDVISFSAVNLPSGLSIDEANGAITGVIDDYLTEDELISTIYVNGADSITTTITWKRHLMELPTGLELINVKSTLGLADTAFQASDYQTIWKSFEDGTYDIQDPYYISETYFVNAGHSGECNNFWNPCIHLVTRIRGYVYFDKDGTYVLSAKSDDRVKMSYNDFDNARFSTTAWNDEKPYTVTAKKGYHLIGYLTYAGAGANDYNAYITRTSEEAFVKRYLSGNDIATGGFILQHLSYGSNSISYFKDTSRTIVPTYNGYPSNWTISPELPGVTIRKDGALVGVPTTCDNVKRTYKISSVSDVDLCLAEVELEISCHVVTTETLRIMANEEINMDLSDDNIDYCTITPSLPKGLKLSSNCILSGISTYSHSESSYELIRHYKNDVILISKLLFTVGGELSECSYGINENRVKIPRNGPFEISSPRCNSPVFECNADNLPAGVLIDNSGRIYTEGVVDLAEERDVLITCSSGTYSTSLTLKLSVIEGSGSKPVQFFEYESNILVFYPEAHSRVKLYYSPIYEGVATTFLPSADLPNGISMSNGMLVGYTPTTEPSELEIVEMTITATNGFSSSSVQLKLYLSPSDTTKYLMPGMRGYYRSMPTADCTGGNTYDDIHNNVETMYITNIELLNIDRETLWPEISYKLEQGSNIYFNGTNYLSQTLISTSGNNYFFRHGRSGKSKLADRHSSNDVQYNRNNCDGAAFNNYQLAWSTASYHAKPGLAESLLFNVRATGTTSRFMVYGEYYQQSGIYAAGVWGNGNMWHQASFIDYDYVYATYPKDAAIPKNYPHLHSTITTNTTITKYSIYPELPNGLYFDETTGEISGIPNTITPLKLYKVTGKDNEGNIYSGSLRIEIKEFVDSTVLICSSSEVTKIIGEEISLTCNGNGNSIFHAENLPEGLSLSTSEITSENLLISGTILEVGTTESKIYRYTKEGVSVATIKFVITEPEAGSIWEYYDGLLENKEWTKTTGGWSVSPTGRFPSKPSVRYYRRIFENNVELSLVLSYVMRVRYQDGIIIYVNGDEIFKRNINEDGTIRIFESAIEEKIKLGQLLKSGSNIIGVEIHKGIGSLERDLFKLELSFEKGNEKNILIHNNVYIDYVKKKEYTINNIQTIFVDNGTRFDTNIYVNIALAPNGIPKESEDKHLPLDFIFTFKNHEARYINKMTIRGNTNNENTHPKHIVIYGATDSGNPVWELLYENINLGITGQEGNGNSVTHSFDNKKAFESIKFSVVTINNFADEWGAYVQFDYLALLQSPVLTCKAENGLLESYIGERVNVNCGEGMLGELIKECTSSGWIELSNTCHYPTTTPEPTTTPLPTTTVPPKPEPTKPAPVCGDGVCVPGENCFNCEEDCNACPPCTDEPTYPTTPEPTPTLYCGDGICTPGENCANCEIDCHVCPPCTDEPEPTTPEPSTLCPPCPSCKVCKGKRLLKENKVKTGPLLITLLLGSIIGVGSILVVKRV